MSIRTIAHIRVVAFVRVHKHTKYFRCQRHGKSQFSMFLPPPSHRQNTAQRPPTHSISGRLWRTRMCMEWGHHEKRILSFEMAKGIVIEAGEHSTRRNEWTLFSLTFPSFRVYFYGAFIDSNSCIVGARAQGPPHVKRGTCVSIFVLLTVGETITGAPANLFD